jgi:lycopene beta-cyclase
VHVIGGGVAGLSLARELAKTPQLPGQVILSDPRTEYTNDRTFGFWLTPDEDALLKPEHRVKRWSISTASEHLIQTGVHYQYGIRSAGSLYQEACEAIDAHPQITRVPSAVESRPDAVHVYDSRPPRVDHFKIVQAFSGTEIRCPTPHGVDTIGLMDALEVTNHGVQFRYVLPLDAHRLLVEHTVFSAEPADLNALDQLNAQWIQSQWSAAQTIRQEAALIPMGYEHPMTHFGHPIGARGGMTRPATGYGYRTMQYWAAEEAARLVKTNTARSYQPNWLHHWMDHLFLDLIRDRPDVIPAVFLAMGRGLTGDQLAQFMMREGWIDALRVIRVSPKKPFSLALIGKTQWI